MKKTVSTLSILLIFAILIFSGCHNGGANTEYIEPLSVSNANMLTGGNAATHENIIYYCSNNTIKMTDGNKSSTVKKFSLQNPYELLVIDNYIYFKLGSGMSPSSYLYRIDKSGSSKKTVINTNVEQYSAYNGYIFFTVSEENGYTNLYKSDLNGKNKTLLVNGDVSAFVCYNNGVLYIDNDTIYRYNIDSQTIEVIVTTPELTPRHLAVNSNILYYCTTEQSNSESKECLNMIDITTKEAQVLYTDHYIGQIHIIDDDRLIFRKESDYVLFDHNSNMTTTFLDKYDDLSEVYVFGDKIYFNTVDCSEGGTTVEWYFTDIDIGEITPVV